MKPRRIIESSARLHPPANKKGPLGHVRQRLFRQHALEWLNDLEMTAEKEGILLSSAMTDPAIPITHDLPKDLIVDFHDKVTPAVANHVLALTRDGRFGVMLILTGREPSMNEEWFRNLSFLPTSNAAEPSEGLLYMPDKDSTQLNQSRILCHGVNFFTRKRMRELLRSIARVIPGHFSPGNN